jgi:hypothetical protein
MTLQAAGQDAGQRDFNGIGNQKGDHTPQQNQPESTACVQIKPKASAIFLRQPFRFITP